MAEMTTKAALAALKPFEDGLSVVRRILEAADRAETAEANALGRTQDAERRIAQAALRADKADSDAEARVREAEGRVQRAEQALQRRQGETKTILEGQVATLTDEVQAERQRLEAAIQARQQADKDLAQVRGEAKALDGVRADLQRAEQARARLEADLADLTQRIDAKQAAYERITADIAALKG